MQEIHIVDLRRLTQLVKEKYNYDLTNYAMSSFKRRISRILELYNFKGLDALTKKVEEDPVFFEEFLSEITVNVTEMFRDPPFWRELKEKIIPNILFEPPKNKYMACRVFIRRGSIFNGNPVKRDGHS